MENNNPDHLIIAESIKKYAKKVLAMRTAQKNFFEAQKAKYAGNNEGGSLKETYLKQSKALEREVDKETEQIILGQTQGNLF